MKESQKILSPCLCCLCWNECFVSSFWESEHHNTVWCELRLVFGHHRFITHPSMTQIHHTCKLYTIPVWSSFVFLLLPLCFEWKSHSSKTCNKSLFRIFNSNYLAYIVAFLATCRCNLPHNCSWKMHRLAVFLTGCCLLPTGLSSSLSFRFLCECASCLHKFNWMNQSINNVNLVVHRTFLKLKFKR